MQIDVGRCRQVKNRKGLKKLRSLGPTNETNESLFIRKKMNADECRLIQMNTNKYR